MRAVGFDDARGSLVPFEGDQLPFVPNRIFIVQSVPAGTIRGCHAHLHQRHMLICVSGRVEVQVRFDHQHQSITLDQPQTGLLIEPGVWSSQRFITDDTILLALASGPYDPNDYTSEEDDHGG